MSSIFSWRSTQQILVQGVKDLLDSIARGDGTSFVKAGLNDPNILIESYRTTNAYVLAAELACALAVFHIVMGEITKNYSQVGVYLSRGYISKIMLFLIQAHC